jgi:hypothetical protein
VIETADSLATCAVASDSATVDVVTGDALRTLATVGPIVETHGPWIIMEFEDAYAGDTIADFESEFASVGAFEVASERP